MSKDPRDELAKHLFDEDSDASTIKQLRQYSYEERVINRVFTESGVAPKSGWGRYVNESREIIGIPKLCFHWFNTTFSFPAQLCGKRLTHMHELTLPDVIKQPNKNKMLKRVLSNLYKLDISAQKQKFVFCFPIVRTLFCVHNLRSQDSSSWDRVDWRFQIAMQHDGVWLFVEPLASFCRGLPASDWFNV